MKKILSKVRRAVDDYNMIDTGDRIAVGVSGGKDSLTLL
ncbi:MAG: tRNA 2-thiocytidine(32) synthetase TtcA, partial [Monoglobaceae bacterium]